MKTNIKEVKHLNTEEWLHENLKRKHIWKVVIKITVPCNILNTYYSQDPGRWHNCSGEKKMLLWLKYITGYIIHSIGIKGGVAGACCPVLAIQIPWQQKTPVTTQIVSPWLHKSGWQLSVQQASPVSPATSWPHFSTFLLFPEGGWLFLQGRGWAQQGSAGGC